MHKTAENFSLQGVISIIAVVLILSLILIVPGCKPVGPDYIASPPELPDTWEEQIIIKLSEEPQSDLETWWGIFNDTVLDQLIAKARNNNKNLQMAYSRVLEARAEVSGVSGKKLPEVFTGVEVSGSKMSDNGSFSQLAPEGGFKTQPNFNVGINASWEIDVFGRVRRTVEAANMQYQASIEDYYDIMVILLADVAINYVDIRILQQLIVNTQINAELQSESLELAEFRYNTGLNSYLDVVQAKANLAETMANIPELKMDEFIAINRLAILLGTTRDSLNREVFETAVIPSPEANIGAGLPADLLRQRPDIRAAERTIAKNNAKIGVATADLYPTFSLTGFLGFDSKSVTTLFTVPGLNWGLSLPVGWQIFNRKRIKANIAINEQRTLQAVLDYENTVLNAITEVENSMVSYNSQLERQKYLNEAVLSNEEAVSLVSTQYNTGLTDFQNVLDTERSMLRQKNKLIECEANIVVDMIMLYKALGGGWEVPADTISVAKQK